MEQSSFDCSTDLYHWHQRWSAEKKATIGACDHTMGSIAEKVASCLLATKHVTRLSAESEHDLPGLVLRSLQFGMSFGPRDVRL